MRIAQRMHELAGLQAGYPGNHQGEQGIGGDVEGFSDIQVLSQIASLNSYIRLYLIRSRFYRLAMDGVEPST